MGKRFRLSAALDVDDLLMECIPYAIRLANEKYKFDPPITIYEVDGWGKLGTRADVIFEYFDDPEFFRTQPVIEGAREFVRRLSAIADVFVSTSVPPKYMGIRAERIMEEFPEIPPEHIYMGSSKERLNVDILFDDGMHNVLRSGAAYPILMRRPWNQNATGMLAVNNYEEFLKLVDVIRNSYVKPENPDTPPDIIVLVGPSGSGKGALREELSRSCELLEPLVSYTTAPKGTCEDGHYRYLGREEFFSMLENGEFFESTMYARHGYASRREDVDKVLKKGKTVLATMDICGAMSLKTNYDNVHTVYVKRGKKELLRAILEKNLSTDDKVNRIISMDDEEKNEEICDHVVEFETAALTAQKLLKMLGMKN